VVRRQTSCSNAGASVGNGSSSFEHHQTPASASHSARISKVFLCSKLASPLSSHDALASRDDSERSKQNHRSKTAAQNTKRDAPMDTVRRRPGERLVFEPYTKEARAETFAWIAGH